ncbi:HAMP domain-containing sensor histidine kinase [Pseudoalteromonas sp. MMG012]|uniref:sensor histidine kinase n=1 Tax=Pseudoalteromonas sp. MMG012 TaxID=2822686 RepID=UPI001B3A4D28|nr:HAMP domain-containing sensor histidine kinase [Pseudoalteromonas sp. MMG012]MBQ4852818.1 HAMP domain-containing histidine kinase [Pseudoalteromonas sp. MMG012]
MKTDQLRNRVIGYFVCTTVVISILYSITSFLFAYNVEDNFFYALLKDEQVVVEKQLAQGNLPDPKLEFIRFYPNEDTLPRTVRLSWLNDPTSVEVSDSNGLHYHFISLTPGFLVAEVSDHLIVRKFREGMLYFLFVMLAIAISIAVVMALASYSVAKRLLKPLDSLMAIIETAPVERLPSGFAHKFKNDEIGTFAMTLEAALKRIRSFVTREQNFTRDVSHELRTPVTISQGAITLLKQTNLDEQQLKLMYRIENAQHQIEQSLQALLALAREDHETNGTSKLLKLVEQSILQQYQYLKNPEIDIDVVINRECEVPIEPINLLILLNNLIGNAFKHTEQGCVSIRYCAPVLTITDTGKGISSELHPHVLEAGTKGTDSEGLGRGLNIVKRLCEQLDIGFVLDSTRDGTQISLTF